MAESKLTALKIKGLTKPGRYGDGGGLYLDVKGDSKSWLFRFKLAGKAKWHGLGPLSEVSLKEAREKALECRKLVREGKNPIEARRAAVAETQDRLSHTFQAVAERCIASKAPGWSNPKTAAQWLSSLSHDVFPTIGSKPVSMVNVDDVLRVLEPIWTLKPETASRVRGRIESVLAYATTRKLRSGENPALWRGHLEHSLTARDKLAKVKHHPAIPYADLAALMEKLSKSQGTAALCLRFIVLTAARSDEARSMTWAEIDTEGALWIAPESRMKGRRTHRVPLSEPAMAILRAAADMEGGSTKPERLVFPGKNPARPLSDVSVSKALRIAGGGDYTVHGMRSTFRDWCAEQTAYPREIAEAALAHTNKDKVEAAYLRSDHFDKRRRLMNEWGAYATTPAPKTGTVVPIRKA